MEALNKGDAQLVQKYLQKGADINCEGGIIGETPLHKAAWQGHTDVTKVLLEAGAPLSTVDDQGETPLHKAAWQGHTDVTKVLLEAGAPLSIVNGQGETPLHKAAWQGHTDVTKVLLEAGAPLSTVDDQGETPLHKAVWNGHKDVTKMLLAAGASLSIVNGQGETPLHKAAWQGHKDVTEVLLKAGAPLSTVDKQGETPLHKAAWQGHKDVTGVLLKAGAPLSTVDDQGKTTLHWAAGKGHKDVTKGRTPYDVAKRDIKQLIKKNETCKPECPVTSDEFLQQRPIDRHLQRLSLEYNIYEVRNIMVFSGLPYADWKALYISTELSDEMKKFEGLKRCFEKNALTFKDLKKVVEQENIRTAHTICEVLRDKFINLDLEPEKWDLVLTDEYIEKLAPLVGRQSLQFLLELDMTFQDWEKINYRQSERDLVQLNCDILEAWKQNCNNHNVRPTLRDIGRAFGNIGKHIKIIESTLFD